MTGTRELASRVLAHANLLGKLENYHCAMYLREASERLSELAKNQHPQSLSDATDNDEQGRNGD